MHPRCSEPRFYLTLKDAIRATLTTPPLLPQSPATGLFVPVPNSRNATGFNRDTFLPNPACTSPLHIRHYRFIGKLMGSGMRTSNPVGLDLPPLFWKRFLGEEARAPPHLLNP